MKNLYKTDTDVSAAQTTQGGQLRNSLNALSFLGGIDSVFAKPWRTIFNWDRGDVISSQLECKGREYSNLEFR